MQYTKKEIRRTAHSGSFPLQDWLLGLGISFNPAIILDGSQLGPVRHLVQRFFLQTVSLIDQFN